MATVTRSTVWVDGNVLTASALNGEFNNLLNALALTNSDIAGGAAIAYSKLNLTGSVVNADINSSAAIVYSKLSLTASIVNADISGSAAIAYSKLALSGAIQNGDLAGSISPSKITGTAAVLTGNTFSGLNTMKSTAQTLITDTDASTVTFDLSAGNIHSVTIAANRTLAVSNATVGQVFVINITQGSGGQVATWFSTIKWPGGSAPTLSSGSGKIDTFAFLCTSGGNYQGYIVGQNL